MKRHSTSPRAFTLVELLVVIAIIAVLIAVLLPVLTRAKQQAQQIQCQANLKTLGHAMLMYTQQYNGYFPGCGVDISGTPFDAACWPVRLRKILGGNQKVFYCPSQDARCQWKDDAPGPNVLASDPQTRFGYEAGERLLFGIGTYFSYGCNTPGSGGGPGFPGRGMGGDTYSGNPPSFKSANRKMTMVKRASDFIMMGDSAGDASGDFFIAPNLVFVGDNVLGDIHRGGLNVLFADGHVQWYLREDLLIPTPVVAQDAPKQRLWNLDNEPARSWP